MPTTPTIAQRLRNLYDNLVLATNTTNEFVEALPDCYDAVEDKGGTIPSEHTAANLPTAIASIPSGDEAYLPNDFNFVDCFGLQQSYSKAEIDAMTELPTPKQYDGLTFDGYSRTLAELKAIACCTIGAYYHTTDGYTWIKVKIISGNYTVGITSRLSGTFIDWGDGTVDTPAFSNNHTYSQEGIYVIKTDCTDLPDISKTQMIEFYVSENLESIGDQTFRQTYNLKTICFPLTPKQGVYQIYQGYALENTILESLVVPPSITGGLWQYFYAMQNNRQLKYVVADGATVMGNRPEYNGTYNITSFSAKNVTETNGNEGSGILPNLKWVLFDNMQTYSNAVISGATRIKVMDLPSSLITISARLVQNGGLIEKMYVRATTPPTMSLAAFSLAYGGVIHVPQNASYTDGDDVTWTGVEAYEHATNWSTFAGSYIADL